MAKKFKSFGVMIDMSRNAVMTKEALKSYLPLLKKMGYNCVMLYTEDTYEIEGLPYFGYMRGRYSVEELKELDAFADSLGIEMIPCVQTLAHLNGTLRWNQIPIDCNDILLTDDEKTYAFLESMFKTLSSCFKSRKIHVGMDEAHMLGRGKHLDIHGYEKPNDIIKRHLAKICDIAKQYDYEVMLWSDMFFRSWNNGMYYIPKTEMPKEVVNAIPQGVIPVYWDYYQTDESKYDNMFHNHKQLSKQVWFAGGAWRWGGFMPHNTHAMKAMLPAMRSCKKNKIENVIITMWGDDGAECSSYAILPSLFAISEFAKGNEDMEIIKKKFKRLTGLEFDEFMMLDAPNNICDNLERKFPVNPCKYMLYSDYFNGFLDYTVELGVGEKYAKYAKELAAIAKKSRKYGYLFDTAAKLCDVLSVKYELGVKTRAAYHKGDLDALRALAENDYALVEKKLGAFAKAFEKQWFLENNPCGFDVQDIRLGAIARRTNSCKRRIIDYVNGKLASIPELEGDVLPFGTKAQPVYVNVAETYLTTNVLYHR